MYFISKICTKKINTANYICIVGLLSKHILGGGSDVWNLKYGTFVVKIESQQKQFLLFSLRYFNGIMIALFHFILPG